MRLCVRTVIPVWSVAKKFNKNLPVFRFLLVYAGPQQLIQWMEYLRQCAELTFE